MFSKEKIRDIVDYRIKMDEKLGDQAGGSGHMSHVDYVINEINEPVISGANWKIRYKYTIIITTEFTYYPDNPPYEYPHTNEIIIDAEGKIIEKS